MVVVGILVVVVVVGILVVVVVVGILTLSTGVVHVTGFVGGDDV